MHSKNGVAFFFAQKGRVAALVPLVGSLFGSSLVRRRVALFLQPFQLHFCRLYMTVPHRPLILKQEVFRRSRQLSNSGVIGAILCMFFIDNRLLGKLFSFVFPLDKLDYGWYVTCGVYVKNKAGRTFPPGENGKKKRII